MRVSILENGNPVNFGWLVVHDPSALQITIILDDQSFAGRLAGRQYDLRIEGDPPMTYSGCVAQLFQNGEVTFLAMGTT